MKRVLALLLIGALVASLVWSSGLAMAQEDDDGEEEETGDDAGGDTENPDDSTGHAGSPEDEQEFPQGDQGPPPSESGYALPDVVKAGIAIGIIGALVVVFVVFMKRGETSPI